MNVGWEAVDGTTMASPINSVGIGGRPPVLFADVRSKGSGAIRISDGNGKLPRDGNAFNIKHCPAAGEEGGVAVSGYC